MKTTTVLGSLLLASMVTIAGCAAEDGDPESGNADLAAVDTGPAPTTTDELAAKLAGTDDKVKVSGPVVLPIPGLAVAPAGNAEQLENSPPHANQSKANPDWVIDLSKVTLFEQGNLKIGFDSTSKAVFKKPVVTFDQNVGPAGGIISTVSSKRLNHFEAVIAGGAQIRTVVQVSTKGGQDAQFWTGKNSETGEQGMVPDPEMTIPIYDMPLIVPVFGIPVQVHPSLAVKIGCHLEFAVNGVVNVGAEYNMDFKKGIEFNLFRRYSKDPEVNFGAGPDSYGFEHDSDFPGDRILNLGYFHIFPDQINAPAPKLIANATAKGAAVANCYVEPQLSVALYEVVGGTAKLHPYAIGVMQADTEKSPPVEYAVTFGMKGGVSAWAKLPILGKKESKEFQIMDLGGGEGQTIKGSFNFGK